MVAFTWIITALAASTASAATFNNPFLSNLMKRQDLSFVKRQNISEGSPLYNCHDNCGSAILEIQGCGNVCNDTTFITDYDNCLQCSGPDNEDIWQYYGSELNTTAAACGFSTTPESGTQADVGAAVTASNSTAACEAASSTATATGSSASASSTSSSKSNAAHFETVNVASYVAIAVGTLFAVGL